MSRSVCDAKSDGVANGERGSATGPCGLQGGQTSRLPRCPSHAQRWLQPAPNHIRGWGDQIHSISKKIRLKCMWLFQQLLTQAYKNA